MSTGHAHALPGTQNEKALWWALGLTGSFLIAEVVAGLILNSLALLADAAQELSVNYFYKFHQTK